MAFSRPTFVASSVCCGFGLLWSSFSASCTPWFGCVLPHPLAPITVLPLLTVSSLFLSPERLIKASVVALVETCMAFTRASFGPPRSVCRTPHTLVRASVAWSAAGLCTPSVCLHAPSTGPQRSVHCHRTLLCVYLLHGPCGLCALLRYAPPQCASPARMVWRLGGMLCVPCWAPCGLHRGSLRSSLYPWLARYVPVCDIASMPQQTYVGLFLAHVR
ncbi:hypothetical protein V6N13_124065 [Hibiscus sabdariffa]